MSIDLDARLDRLATIPVPAPPPVADLVVRAEFLGDDVDQFEGPIQLDGDERDRRSRGFILLAAAAAIILIAAVAVLLEFESTPRRATTKPDAPVSTTVPEATAPAFADGVPISGPGGGIAGWVDQETWDRALDEGPPLVRIGTGEVEVRGFEVRDETGELVGYYLAGGVGFVTVEMAADPGAVDELVRSTAPLSQEELAALMAEMKRRLEAEGGG